jgi:hypothetical protein
MTTTTDVVTSARLASFLCDMPGSLPVASFLGAINPAFPWNWVAFAIVGAVVYFALPDGYLTAFLRSGDRTDAGTYRRSKTKAFVWSILFTVLVLWVGYMLLLRFACGAARYVDANASRLSSATIAQRVESFYY